MTTNNTLFTPSDVLSVLKANKKKTYWTLGASAETDTPGNPALPMAAADRNASATREPIGIASRAAFPIFRMRSPAMITTL